MSKKLLRKEKPWFEHLREHILEHPKEHDPELIKELKRTRDPYLAAMKVSKRKDALRKRKDQLFQKVFEAKMGYWNSIRERHERLELEMKTCILEMKTCILKETELRTRLDAIRKANERDYRRTERMRARLFGKK